MGNEKMRNAASALMCGRWEGKRMRQQMAFEVNEDIANAKFQFIEPQKEPLVINLASSNINEEWDGIEGYNDLQYATRTYDV